MFKYVLKITTLISVFAVVFTTFGAEVKPGQTLICIDPGHQGKGNRLPTELPELLQKKANMNSHWR